MLDQDRLYKKLSHVVRVPSGEIPSPRQTSIDETNDRHETLNGATWAARLEA